MGQYTTTWFETTDAADPYWWLTASTIVLQ